VVWVDESGFYLLPSVVRTYAPRGQTPVLRAPLTRDHLAVISGVTAGGRLLVQVREQPFRGPTIVDFLRHLARHIAGKLLVIWDGAPIHRAQPVKDFLATEQGQRVHLERLPGYAPEVNPDEGIWQYLKRVELRNLVCKDLPELQTELRLAIARLRHKLHVIRGCFTQCGYAV
jgi:transposase